MAYPAMGVFFFPATQTNPSPPGIITKPGGFAFMEGQRESQG